MKVEKNSHYRELLLYRSYVIGTYINHKPKFESLFSDVRTLRNRSHVQECHEQVKRTLQEYCFNCYPSVPVSHTRMLHL